MIIIQNEDMNRIIKAHLKVGFSIVISIFFHTLPVMPKMAYLVISFINVKSYEFTETYRRSMTKGL